MEADDYDDDDHEEYFRDGDRKVVETENGHDSNCDDNHGDDDGLELNPHRHLQTQHHDERLQENKERQEHNRDQDPHQQEEQDEEQQQQQEEEDLLS